MKLALLTPLFLLAAFTVRAQETEKSTTQTSNTSTTSSGSAIVVDGRTNGIVIRKSVVNGQPADVDIQVIGDGLPGDLGTQIAAQVQAATVNALSAAGGVVDGLAQGFAFAFDDKDQFFMSGVPGRKGDRAVVVSAGGVDAKTRAEWQEDLNVMARLLEKAGSQPGGGAKAQAMGIQLMTFGAGRPAAHFYLEGYGAVVQVNVAFPLVPTGPKPEARKAEPKPESDWDRVRRELYGSNRPSGPHRIEVVRTHKASGAAYDAERVEKFKAAVVEALKNATNIRHLKRGENLALVISGPGEGSTLTLTAPKSALDDLAKGRLSVEEFLRKHPFAGN